MLPMRSYVEVWSFMKCEGRYVDLYGGQSFAGIKHSIVNLYSTWNI